MNEHSELQPESTLSLHGAIEAKIHEISDKGRWDRLYRAGVLTILVLIVLMVFWTVQQFLVFGSENYGRAKMDVKSLESAVLGYQKQYGDFPPSLDVLAEFQQDGGPSFIDKSLLVDPWGHPYGYSREILHPKTRKPLIISSGPPGQNVLICNWPNK